MEKIYFCRENDSNTKFLYKTLKAIFPKLKVKRKDCLGKCKTCKSNPFAIMDDKVVSCGSVADLFHEVSKQMLKEPKKHRKV